jgi:hypothetical protein
MEVTFVIGQISLVSVILLLVSFLIIANHFSKLLRALQRPQRWEYRIDGMDVGGDVPQFQEEFNRLGEEGWEATVAWVEPKQEEIVAILFKRPI